MIAIKNIYYMLAYAFDVLQEQGYRFVETEEFDNVADLLSAILIKGVSMQVKRGLNKEYIETTESKTLLCGKIEILESIKNMTIIKRQLLCTYDDLSINTYMHQILKATFRLLLRTDISKERKKKIRNLILYFKDVDDIDVRTIRWDLQYQRNNQTYEMLIAVCNLVVKGLLQTQSDGKVKLMDFLDEQRMWKLYQNFIREYYRKEYPELKVSAAYIPWQLDDEGDTVNLPSMQTDVTIIHDWQTLILDAKYYSSTMQHRYDKATIHSGNLYQIFTYVKNKQAQFADDKHEVSGMLLYAKTDENVYPDNEYKMSGNKISVRTLDLDQDFDVIKKELDAIIVKHFAL